MDMNATLDFDEEFVELAANFGESKKRLSSLQNRKESLEKEQQARMENLNERHEENLLELKRKHDENLLKLRRKHAKEIKNLEDEQSKARVWLIKYDQNLINQVTEKINKEEICKNNIGKKLKKKYQDQDDDDIPECPICLNVMIPPLEIYQCLEGHFICSDCRPRWREGCATCRDRRGYESRCRYVEDMIQKKMRKPV